MHGTETATFGILLRRLRRDAGLTQEELAERAGLSPRGIGDIERGISRKPYHATVEQLAAALELSPADRAALLGAAQRQLHHADHLPDLPVGGFLGSAPEGPLVARAHEMERIGRVVETVSGGTGQVLLLAGEPGVGKTRLAQEATLVCRAIGMQLATGRCYEPLQAEAFCPFLEILTWLVAMARSRLRIDPVKRWPQVGRLLPDHMPPAVDTVDGGAREQQKLFWGVAGLIEALAGTAPVALALDDLQWADQSSLELLQHLARHLRNAPVLLMGIYRELGGERPSPRTPLSQALGAFHREHLSEDITVGRWQQDGTRALMASIFGDQGISPEFVDLVHRHTEGNAFFIQEVLRGLVERGDVFEQDGVWDRRMIEEIAIPRSVRDAIGERLMRLSLRAQTTLAEASVLGQVYSFDDLQAMGDRPEQEVEDDLEEAACAGIIRAVEGDSYAFNHVLTQQTLATQLTPRRKRRLHLAAGNAIERQPERIRQQRAAELAWHFREADDSGRALRYATLAGDKAQMVFAHGEAERHYRAALELAQERGDTAIEAELQQKLGQVLFGAGQYEEAIAVFERAIAVYGARRDLEGAGRATALLGRAHRARGTPEEGICRVEPMVELLARGSPSSALASLHIALAHLYFLAGRYREMRDSAERGEEVAQLVGDQRLLGEAGMRRGTALQMLDQLEEGHLVLEQALPLVEAGGDLDTLFITLNNLGAACQHLGRMEEMRRWSGRALEVAERMGNPTRTCFALGSLGLSLTILGEWQEARGVLERSVELTRTMTLVADVANSLTFLGRLALEEGKWGEASQHLHDALAVTQGTSDRQFREIVQASLAELEVLEGRPEEAVNRLEPLAEQEDATLGWILSPLAWAYLVRDETEQVRRAEETAERAVAQGRQRPGFLVEALWIQGMVFIRQRRYPDAERALDEGLTLAGSQPYPYIEGRILYTLGLMHGEREAPQRAQELLERALAIFQRLGAQPYIERTERALHDLG